MLADASIDAGNGVGYSGDTDRGPGKAKVSFGMVQVDAGSAHHVYDTTVVAADALGNVYVAGEVEMGTIGHYYATAFIAKFAPNGNQLWGRSMGTDGRTNARVVGIQVDAQGRVFVFGSQSGQSIPAAQVYGSGAEFAYASEIDPATGAFKWVSELHTPSGLNVAGSAIDPSGNLYFCGTSFNSDVLVKGQVHGKLALTNIYAAKFDPTGSLLSTAQVGSGEDSGVLVTGMAVSPAGDIWITGSAWTSTGASGQINGPGIVFQQFNQHGPVDLLVVHLLPGGVVQVSQLGATTDEVVGTGIAVDAATGDVLVSGENDATMSLTANSLGGVAPFGHGIYDMVVARFDTSAKLKWVEELGLAGNYLRTVGVAQDPAGDIYLGGYAAGFGQHPIFPGAATYGSQERNFDVVVRLDGAGSIRWITEIGIAHTSLFAGSLFANPSGGVYVGGTSNSNVESGGVLDQFMLFTLDPNGYIQ
jgi:hypothetical protein